MALTTYTLSGGLDELDGVPLAAPGTKIVVDATDGWVPDESTGHVRRGEYVAVVDEETGTFSVPGIPATVDGAPLYQVKVRPPGLNPRDERVTRAFAMDKNLTLAEARARSVTPTAVDPDVAADIAGAVAAVPVVQTLKADVLAAKAAVDARVVEDLGTTDGQTKALIETPASQTAQALAATFAPVALTRPGNRYVSLGDSITAGGVDNGNRALGEAWPNYAALRSQGRLRLVRNAGIPGNKSADMLARFDTDVAPYAPNIVSLAAGTNDIGNAVPFATYKANMIDLLGKIRSIAAVPVLCTIPPRSDGYGPTVVQWNGWLRDTAERSGIALVDMYRLLANPADGKIKTAYENGTDLIHPGSAGAAAMGEVAAHVLAPLTPAAAPMLPVDAADTHNLLGSAGLFLSAQGSGVGTGWTPGTAPSNTVKEVITDPFNVGGTQRITMANANGLWQQVRDISTGWAVGDVVRAVGVVSSNGGTNAAVGVTISFTGATGGSGKPLTGFGQAFTRGVYSQDLVVPAGTTAIRYGLQCGAAGASCVVEFAQIGLYNLTQMGLSS